VGAVESREREERRAEQVRLDGQSFMHEGGELVCLKAEKGRAHERGRGEPELRVAEQRADVPGLAAVFDGRQGEHHHQR